MKSLNEWMDSNGITPEQAAEFFGKSVGTIRNWRSAGVPRNQREWVEKRITEWTGRPLPSLPDRVTIEASREQFRAWNKASLAAGQLIEDWAVEALDAAAEAAGLTEQGHAADPTGSDPAPDPVGFAPEALAAEDPGNYRAGDATLGAPSPSPRTRDSA